MNRYQKRIKPVADNDAPGSFLLSKGTDATRPGDTPWAGPVPLADGYKS
jgi:hypothetical protein